MLRSLVGSEMCIRDRDCHDCAGAVVYRRCRILGLLPFTLHECPVGSIINIQSAKVGFYRTQHTLFGKTLWLCEPRANASCTRSIINDPAIVSCNGQRECTFWQNILDYPQHDVARLCDEHKDGNFVWIEYNCIESKKHVKMSLLFNKIRVGCEFICLDPTQPDPLCK